MPPLLTKHRLLARDPGHRLFPDKKCNGLFTTVSFKNANSTIALFTTTMTQPA
jgi:hypothetical protein